jgi:sporulation protein YlmC with PRC-barrel domain
MDSKRNNMIVEDWQSLGNKPLYSRNGKDIGIVRSVQPQFLITSFGSITQDRYLIPKTSVQSIKDGIIYINEDSNFVEQNLI